MEALPGRQGLSDRFRAVFFPRTARRLADPEHTRQIRC